MQDYNMTLEAAILLKAFCDPVISNDIASSEN